MVVKYVPVMDLVVLIVQYFEQTKTNEQMKTRNVFLMKEMDPMTKKYLHINEDLLRLGLILISTIMIDLM